MSAVTVSWVVLCLYLLAIFWITYYAWRKVEAEKTLEEFYVAGRSLGTWVVSFSFFATLFSTSAFIGGGGTGFLMGFQWPAYFTLFNVIFAVAAWVFIAPRLRKYTEKLGAITIPQFFELRYDSKMAKIVASLIIIVFFEYHLISIYKGSGNVFQEMLGISYLSGIILMAVPVIIYTYLGAFRAVALTDLIQGVIMVVGMFLLFGLVLSFVGGWSHGIAAIKSLSLPGGVSGEALTKMGGYGPPPVRAAGQVIPFILSISFAICLANMSAPQLIIRFCAARNQAVIRNGMILTPLLVGLFSFTVYSVGPFAWLIIPKIAGPAAVTTYLKDPDLVIPFVVVKLFPPGVGALLLAAIVAAGMSTLNSYLILLGSTIAGDVIRTLKPTMPERTLVLLTRIMIVVVAIIPILGAINPPGIIVTIVGLAFSVITSAFVAPLVFGLYWRGSTGTAAWVSMVVATVTCIVWQLKYYPVYWIYPVVPGLAVSVPIFVLVSLLTRKPPEEVVSMVGGRESLRV